MERGHDANGHDDTAPSRGGDPHESDWNDHARRVIVHHESVRRGNDRGVHDRRLSSQLY